MRSKQSQLALRRLSLRGALLTCAKLIAATLTAATLIACDDEPKATPEPQGGAEPQAGAGAQGGAPLLDLGPLDQGPVGGALDLGPLDEGLDAELSDMEWVFDLDVPPEIYDERAPETSRLRAGYAERSLGFPLGAAVVGFGPREGVVTPFAQLYPGTDTQHTPLTARALILRSGARSLVIVRTDMIGVWQDFVVDIQRQLNQLGRADLSDGLIISATHTHASGGRVFNHPLGRVAVGPFKEEYYTRYRRAVLSAILEADAGMFDAQAGYKTLQVESIHSDRRCENGPVQDDSMGLLKITDDQGALKALIVNYAMHGTIVNNDQFVLSGDAPGAVERGIEQRLPSHAPVLYLQSWAGDMSPEAPREHINEAGSDARDDFKQLDAIALEAARQVIPALDEIETSAALSLEVKSIRVPARNELINPDGSFDRYAHGGTFCMPAEANCDEPQRVYTPETLTCIPVPASYGVDWLQLTTAWIGSAAQRAEGGGLALATLPGEPLTSVGVELRDRVREATRASEAWVLGYAQGYLAYLLHPDDFYLGGYEGQGALWGPGFGQFLIDRGVEISAHMMDSSLPMSFRPLSLPELEPFEEVDLPHERALSAPSWLIAPELDERGLWSASWAGGDPAVDAPLVRLERLVSAEGAEPEWETVRHASGLPWSSQGMELQLSLSVDPPYTSSLELEERSFKWRVELPQTYAVEPSIGQLSGQLRFVVSGELPEPYELVSEGFELRR